MRRMPRFKPIEISLAKVREFQEFLELFPQWTNLKAGDVKAFQWPWAITRVLRHVPRGAAVLDYGAGDCAVAGPLSQLGYRVTAVDPYQGNDGGPTGFERYQAAFPNVQFVPDVLSRSTRLPETQYDAILSVSVVEHVPLAAQADLADAIAHWLKPGGLLIDTVDFTARGKILVDFPFLDEVLRVRGFTDVTAATLAQEALDDPDTYFLSPAAHRSWRGKRSYDDYPYRQATCVNLISRLGK